MMVLVCAAILTTPAYARARLSFFGKWDEAPTPKPEPELPARSLSSIAKAVPYGEIIDSVAAAQGVPADLVRALIQVESNFRKRAHSRKGAMGLMQLTPATARRFGVSDPYNPRQNIEGGIKFLRTLLDRFQTTSLALAAYNAGEGAVDRFQGIPPYTETQDYVSRILHIMGQESSLS